MRLKCGYGGKMRISFTKRKAAEKLGMLSKYVAWLTKKGPSEMNLTTLVTFDSGKETRKKGGKTGTARRKGGRSSKAPPVSTIVDRPFHVNTTAQLTPNSTACPLQTQQRSAPFQSPSMPQQPLPARSVHVHRASSIVTSAAIFFTTILFTTNSAVESTYVAEFTISWYYIYSNTFIWNV